MEAVHQQKFVRYSTLSPFLEPDDDLELKFVLQQPDEMPTNDCAKPVFISCTEVGIDGLIESATLWWTICGLKQPIEAEPQDIEVIDGQTMSVTFVIEDFNQNNVNDFEVHIIQNNQTYKIARGRIYL